METEVIELRDFTKAELAKYNGVDDPKIYIAIKGKVFDVTPSKHFYGSGRNISSIAFHL